MPPDVAQIPPVPPSLVVPLLLTTVPIVTIILDINLGRHIIFSTPPPRHALLSTCTPTARRRPFACHRRARRQTPHLLPSILILDNMGSLVYPTRSSSPNAAPPVASPSISDRAPIDSTFLPCPPTSPRPSPRRLRQTFPHSPLHISTFPHAHNHAHMPTHPHALPFPVFSALPFPPHHSRPAVAALPFPPSVPATVSARLPRTPHCHMPTCSQSCPHAHTPTRLAVPSLHRLAVPASPFPACRTRLPVPAFRSRHRLCQTSPHSTFPHAHMPTIMHMPTCPHALPFPVFPALPFPPHRSRLAVPALPFPPSVPATVPAELPAARSQTMKFSHQSITFHCY